MACAIIPGCSETQYSGIDHSKVCSCHFSANSKFVIMQKPWSAFNFYSNALSVVIFSFKMVFSANSLSFAADWPKSVLLKRLVCKRLPSSHGAGSSASISGGTADVHTLSNERLLYSQSIGSRFVHINTRINQELNRRHPRPTGTA